MVDFSYVYEYVYWYTSEPLKKRFVDKFGKIFHVDFLGYAHWFLSIRIPQMKNNFISVDQAKYDTSIIAKCLDTTTDIASTKFIIAHFNMIIYSQKMIHLPVMKKMRNLLGNSTFTTELALVHCFIFCPQDWNWVLQCTC